MHVSVRTVYKIRVGKPEGERTFGRHTSGQEYNIKMYFKEILCRDVYWKHLT
jgi:hypothetical protein